MGIKSPTCWWPREGTPATACAPGSASSPGREGEERGGAERAWESGGERRPWGWGAGMIGILRRPPGRAALGAHPLAPGCTFISRSPGRGALWAPSNACVLHAGWHDLRVYAQCPWPRHTSRESLTCSADPRLCCLTSAAVLQSQPRSVQGWERPAVRPNQSSPQGGGHGRSHLFLPPTKGPLPHVYAPVILP